MNKIVSVILLILIIFFVSASVYKAIYWPPTSYDAIAGYDYIGKMIAKRGFDKTIWLTPGLNNRANIPPLIPLMLALCYVIGVNSQVIMSVFLVGLVIMFYKSLEEK